MKRYLVDNAYRWRDDAINLTVEGFLKEIKEAEEEGSPRRTAWEEDLKGELDDAPRGHWDD